jgi:hypothetical protein
LYQTAIWEDVFDNFPEPDPDTNLTPAVTVPPGSTQTLILDGWRLTDAQMRDFGYLGGTQTKDRHQCILAEIEAASGNADFVTRSAYTNMIVGSLSTFSKTAVVDSGSSDFAFRDVYMFVMTKNMPATVDAGVTGRSIVQANAYRVAQEIRAQYEEDPIVIDLKAVNGRRPDEMMSIAYRLEYFSRRQQCGGEGSGSGTGSGSGRECNWPELIQDLVEWMPADIAARVLPTAEIYSYLDTGSRVRRGSRVKRSVEPMTSFGFHLYHDGGLEGFRQVLDGADVLGPNLYRVRLGADGRTVVQARSQAIDTGERPIKPDPQWDPVRDGCDDYCPPTRGGFVGLIALWGLTILGVRRLLRRRKSSI